ncbi:NB-ARC domain-containing protein [Nocardia rhamnosiphila]|uniref:NB-ARC domain-containing protein n=1 Tax=Nocardia rhamnosiphila TaxID=426716 RepID=A0ABV2WIT3_9NOCA
MLDIVDKQPRAASTVVTIEDIHDSGTSLQTMDFSVRSGAGDESFVEIKYTSRNTTGISEVVKCLLRMVEFGEASNYVMVTNTSPTSDIDALNSILRSWESDARLRQQLLSLVSRSPDVADRVAGLDPAMAARLCRARVACLSVDLDQFYMQIKDRVRNYRRSRGLALGQESAEVLMGRLIAAIFQRAARAPESRLNREDFEELLATGPYVLAQAVGVDDTGVGISYVPAVGTVLRDAPMTRLTESLAHGICNSQPVYCALHGRSGIGKTRLAATYAHAHRHAYDRILWFNAATSATLTASIVTQAWMLGLSDFEELPEDEIAAAFRHALAQFPGTWLVVFDDAPTARGLQPWLPTAGWGHVLVTTLDRRHWQEFAPVPIGALERDEARELLAVRLGTDDPALSPYLDNLAIALDRWPLALEVAAAHIGSSDDLARMTGTYIEEVKTYAIGDGSLDLPGYPRSLLAAIDLCIDRLDRRATHHHPTALARRMLTIASYFAQHDIPADLTYQCAVSTPADALADAEFDVPPPRRDPAAPATAARAALESVSILDYATRPGPGIRPELVTRIEINDIVQQIVRTRGDADNALETTAIGICNWIYHYVHDGDYLAARHLAQHGAHLLEHAGDSSVAPWEVAALAGTLAHLYRSAGQLDIAIEHLDYELDLLMRHQRSPSNVVQTQAMLLEMLPRTPAPTERILQVCLEMLDFLDDLENIGEPVDATTAARARLSALQALRILYRSNGDPAARAEYNALSERCLQALTDVPSDPRLERVRLGVELDTRFDDSATSGEIELARTIVELHDGTDPLGLMTDLARLAHAYTRADQYNDAHSLLTEIQAIANGHPGLSVGTPDTLLNTVSPLMLPMLDSHQPTSLPFIHDVLKTAAIFPLDGYDHYRHMVYTGLSFIAAGDLTAARHLNSMLSERHPPERPNHVQSTAPILALRHLLDYWVECSNAGTAPSVTTPRHAGFAYGGQPGGPSTIFAMLTVPDDTYRVIHALNPADGHCTITIRSTDNGIPLFMVLRNSTGAPLCGITAIFHQEFLRKHPFHAVVIRPESRTRAGRETGTVQLISEGIPAIVE